MSESTAEIGVSARPSPSESAARDGSSEFPELESATLLVHIAFHFVEARLQYLLEVLGAFREYRLRSIEIVVDSNDEATRHALAGLDLGSAVTLSVQVHRDLTHPFLLTWQHRPAFTARQHDFDYYLYLEDDIRVPWTTFAPWATELPILERHGWLRGVLRVEPDHQGQLMASDWYRPMRNPVVCEVEGRRYIRPEEPYQACWCASRGQLERFLATEAWCRGAHHWSHVRARIPRFDGDWFIRERASLGPIHSPVGSHRTLVPINAAGSVSPVAFVHHLPANYALNPASRYAKIPTEHLLCGDPTLAGSIRAMVANLQRELTHWAMRLTGPHPIRSVRAMLRRLVKGSL